MDHMMSELRLFNTMAGEKQVFVPADPGRVTLYVCGPTVYARAHIGNARPAVVFDTLFRLLRARFGAEAVVYARNITDVDDKINAAAAAAGTDISEITQRFTAIYRDDMRALGNLDPTLEPTVTGHIAPIIDLVQRLVEAGHAYATSDGVYFHVPSMPDYGRLSRRALDDMIAGARVETDPAKRHPADFALWKAAKPGEPSWPAPFGAGRPGWHIECSAMIAANLGTTIDLHGGGHDLIFPHHENEIAQSACAHGGAPLARFWLHNGFVTMESDKMSKSLGNVQQVSDILARWPGEAARLALLSAHYRAPLDWTEALLVQSVRTLDRLYRALEAVWDSGEVEPQAPDGLMEALCDDLNTPRAMAELSLLARRANKAEADAERRSAKAALLGAGGLLGLLGQSPAAWFAARSGAGAGKDAGLVAELVAARQAARGARDWAEADRLRERLAGMGVEVTDGKDGPAWRFVA